jgi:GntR family transcriptional regulator
MQGQSRSPSTPRRNNATTAKSKVRRERPTQASLDRDSATALYMQIAELLRAAIDAGTFAADSKLPAENELTRRFDVSRVTVRQAIAQLVADGYVISRQGKGTFVSRNKLVHDLKPMRGFYDALIAQGVEPKTKLLDFGPVAMPDAARHAFDAGEDECFRLRRLYLVDGEPIALVDCYLPPQARGLTWEQVNRNPIYVLLEKLLALPVARADIHIRARSAGTAIGQALGLPPRAALLVMERESFGGDGILRERSSFFIRPENYEFTLSVQGPLPVGSSIKNVNGATPA